MSFAYVEAAGCVHCTQDFVTFVTDDGLTECALQVSPGCRHGTIDLLVRKGRIDFEPNCDSLVVRISDRVVVFGLSPFHVGFSRVGFDHFFRAH